MYRERKTFSQSVPKQFYIEYLKEVKKILTCLKFTQDLHYKNESKQTPITKKKKNPKNRTDKKIKNVELVFIYITQYTQIENISEN